MPKIKISILWQSISALLIPSIVCIPVYAQQDEVICLSTDDIVKIINILLDIPVEPLKHNLSEVENKIIIQIGPFSPSRDRRTQEMDALPGLRTTQGSCPDFTRPERVQNRTFSNPVVVVPTMPASQTQPVVVPFSPNAPVARFPTTPPATVLPSISSQRQVHYVVIRVRQEDLLNIFEKLILLKVPERGIFQIQSQPTPILLVGPFATPEIAGRWKKYLQDFLF